MVETITTQQPKFTTLIYETKDGEKVSATKKDGIVTLVGDKNGVRQMELEKFMKEELPNNVKNLQLEKTPEKDTVEISKPAAAEETKSPAAVTNPIAPVVKTEENTPEVEEKKLNVVV